jgi:hypothetical protein
MVKINVFCNNCGVVSVDDDDNPYIFRCPACGSKNTELTLDSIMKIGRNVKRLFPEEKPIKFVDMGFKADCLYSGEKGTEAEFMKLNSIVNEGKTYYRNIVVLPSFATLKEAESKVYKLCKNPDNWVIVKYRNVIDEKSLYLLNSYKDGKNTNCYEIIEKQVRASYGDKISLDGYCYVIYTTEVEKKNKKSNKEMVL